MSRVPGVILAVAEGKLRLVTSGKQADLDTPGTVASPAHAALAPDGSYVAAVLQDGTTSRLWVHSLRGQPDRTAELPAQAEDVTWAPDATYFAYRTGPDAVVVADLHGEAEPITFDGDRVIAWSWGPGSRLAVLAQSKGSLVARIWRWAPGEKPAVLAEDAQLQSGWTNWSPDGANVAFVASGGLTLSGRGGRELLLKTEDVKVAVAATSLQLSGPKWSAEGGRIAVKAMSQIDGSGDRWFVVTAGARGEKPAVWAAPAYPCYVYGYWWATGTDLLVQIAGPDCSKMVVLNGESAQVLDEFPILLKGAVLLSADRTRVAISRQDGPATSELVPLRRPGERVIAPLRDLVGWCCVPGG